MAKLHRCASPKCFELVGGAAKYCPGCQRQHKLEKQKALETKRIKDALMSLPTTKAPKSMHTLTSDIQLMRELGFNSYGQLSTWRREQKGATA